MMQFIISAVAFVATIGILITAHEFGHFWVARKLGVRVLRFSVGFGKPIWRRQRTPEDTEYVLAAIPLGGYIKMLDEREMEVPAELRHQAFNVQTVWKRFAIVAAGPVFNFILAVLVYTFVYLLGIPGIKPIVDQPEASSYAARAGFEFKDEIIQVEEQATRSWQQVRMAILDSALSQAQIRFQVKSADGRVKQLNMSLDGARLFKEQVDILERLGLNAWWPPLEAVIGVVEDGAAKRAGLLPGDKILGINDQEIRLWTDLVEVIRDAPLSSLTFIVLREGEQIELLVTPESKRVNGEVIGYIGAGASRPIQEVEKLRVTVHYPFFQSIIQGFSETGRMIVLTFKMLGKLVTGEASLKNISGPISIADYAGKSVSIDFSYYLKFLAIISISLGVLNLLPIPVLDGGHLFYYLIEIVKGSPVSEKFLLIGQQIGIVLLGCLMSLAIYNDLVRFLGN